MGLFSGYDGKALNHVELLYQRGDREQAIEFMRLLGCAPVVTDQKNDTGSTYVCVHPDANDLDVVNNVLYLSEIRAPHHDLEVALRNSIAKDADLREAVGAYRHKAATLPYGTPHFGLRFPSFASIEPVLERLANITDPAMKDRVDLIALRPGDPSALTDTLIQSFVYTDIVASGLFALGQVIELQAQRAPSDVA